MFAQLFSVECQHLPYNLHAHVFVFLCDVLTLNQTDGQIDAAKAIATNRYGRYRPYYPVRSDSAAGQVACLLKRKLNISPWLLTLINACIRRHR